jgi:hypothetical protein
MSETSISIEGESFLVNGRPTYSEIPGSNPSAHGLLMNQRLIQGVFDDKAAPSRFARLGRSEWDPERNTDDLIAALPEWHRYGLRAFTVGFQGGGPCFTIDNYTIANNPFGEDGMRLDPAYAGRMERLIRSADSIGMAVIVSFFYGAQTRFLRDGKAVRNAVTTAARFLKEGGFTNVLIEVANEHDIGDFRKHHPILYYPEGMVALFDLARKESGGIPVGTSRGGNSVDREICEGADYLLIHGNGCSRQQYYNLICRAREFSPGKPVVCNEDSQAIGQLEVAFKTRSSWGYFNQTTKQEPPADWRVLPGEDTFFAHRMAMGIGIDVPEIPVEEQYHLHGLEPHMEYEGKRWIRLGSLYPESINYVDFYRNGELVYTSYDEPFTVFFHGNWDQGPWIVRPDDREWKAVAHLRNGETVEKRAAAG